MSARPRNSLRIVLVLAAAAAVVAGVAYAGLALLRPVAEVEPVVGGDALDAKPASVTVKEEYSMELKSELGGRVLAKDFNLNPGAQVKKGDVLAQLDPAELLLEIAKEKIDQKATRDRYDADHSSELKLKSAHEDLANYERLNKLGSYATEELVKRGREVDAMEQAYALEKIDRQQTLDTFDNTLAAENLKLQNMTIASPLDGTVSQVYAHPGDLIGAGASVATLITTNKVVEGRISEEDFAQIRVGETANVTFLPYGDWEFDGTVTKILPTADPETQRHIVHLDVKVDAAHPLSPGINGEAIIIVGKRDAKAIVPRRALFNLDGDRVFVVKDGVVELRKVKAGYVWSRGAEILEGLEPGEDVIVDELETFHPGDRVRVHEVPSDVAPEKK